MPSLYDSPNWREYRSERVSADSVCALAHLAGGCRGALNLHHIDPLAEGGPAFPDEGGTVLLCAAHHAWIHAWRRRKERKWKRCPHQHRSLAAREQCERRLNRAAA